MLQWDLAEPIRINWAHWVRDNATNTMIQKWNYGEPISQTFCAQSRRGDFETLIELNRLDWQTHISHNLKIKKKKPPLPLHPRNPNPKTRHKPTNIKQKPATKRTKPSDETALNQSIKQIQYSTHPKNSKPQLQNRPYRTPFHERKISQKLLSPHASSTSYPPTTTLTTNIYIHTAEPPRNETKRGQDPESLHASRDKIHRFH